MRDYGKTPVLNAQGIVHTVGIRARDNWEHLQKKYDIDESVDRLFEKRLHIYLEMLKRELAPMPGLMDLLDRLKAYGLRLAIASSSVRPHIDTAVDLLMIRQYFQVIVSGAEVKKGKPHPDIFLEAARPLGLAPADCLVIEDAENGVMAARAAGMKVIAVPSRFTAHHNLSAATAIVPSLHAITIELIQTI
ncbi:MAG: HAD family hydrolase [Nanoarchaeota archaeon]